MSGGGRPSESSPLSHPLCPQGQKTERENTMTPQEQAYEVWQKFGKMETVMVAILTQLIATVEELQKEKGTEQ